MLDEDHEPLIFIYLPLEFGTHTSEFWNLVFASQLRRQICNALCTVQIYNIVVAQVHLRKTNL